MSNQNCLSYWLPRLQQAGVATPRTAIITTAVDLRAILDGIKPDGFDEFVGEIQAAADGFGYPCFLRTGQGSGKHGWQRTCYLQEAARIPHHIAALAEWSEIADFLGLPYNVWAVREWLDLNTRFTAFEEFPVNRERRYFLRDGQVQCHHPYWPPDSILGHTKHPSWQKDLADLNQEPPEEVRLLTALATQVAQEFPGYWSLDFAMTRSGEWYAIDMALGDQSFHWSDCPIVKKDQHHD